MSRGYRIGAGALSGHRRRQIAGGPLQYIDVPDATITGGRLEPVGNVVIPDKALIASNPNYGGGFVRNTGPFYFNNFAAMTAGSPFARLVRPWLGVTNDFFVPRRTSGQVPAQHVRGMALIFRALNHASEGASGDPTHCVVWWLEHSDKSVQDPDILGGWQTTNWPTLRRVEQGRSGKFQSMVGVSFWNQRTRSGTFSADSDTLRLTCTGLGGGLLPEQSVTINTVGLTTPSSGPYQLLPSPFVSDATEIQTAHYAAGQEYGWFETGSDRDFLPPGLLSSSVNGACSFRIS